MPKRETGFRWIPNADGEYELVKVLPEKNAPAGNPVGSTLRTTYLAMYDDGHNRRFYKEKDYDIVARIQSFEQHCLLSNIISRCQNGDVAALQRVRGQYVDCSGAPLDSRGAHDLLNRARGVFDALSKEEKARYNDNFKDFVGSFGSTSGINAFLESRMKPAAATAADPAAAAAASPTAATAAATNVTGGTTNES